MVRKAKESPKAKRAMAVKEMRTILKGIGRGEPCVGQAVQRLTHCCYVVRQADKALGWVGA